MKLLIIILFFFQTAYAASYCLHPEAKANPLLEKPLQILLEDPSGNKFKIQIIESGPDFCINPGFPIIVVETEPKADAWIQVIYTNSELGNFLDYDPKITPKPFYSFNNYFYDAPLWSLDNNLIWKANLFSVKLDENKKIIQIIGGIQWGFEIKDGKVLTMKPSLLDEIAWELDIN